MHSTTTAPAYVCSTPWCTDHADGTPPGRAPDPADQICRHVVTGEAFGEFLVTYDTTDGIVLRLDNTNFELSDGDALEFITAVNATITQARTAVAL